MGRAKLIRSLGVFCIVGAAVGIIWALIITVYPNSSGSSAGNDFVVLHPLAHRLEHLFAGLFVYPALFSGLLGYYFAGAVGKSWFGKILLTLAIVGVILASVSSLIETVVLQWETADILRGYGFVLLLLFSCPLLFGIGALIYRKVSLGKRILPILLPIILFLAGFSISSLGANENWIAALTLIGWSIFGYAVYTEGLKENEQATL